MVVRLRARRSPDFEYFHDRDTHVGRQISDTHRRACMVSALAQDGEQLPRHDRNLVPTDGPRLRQSDHTLRMSAYLLIRPQHG